jgi:hypothetical protein
MKRMMLVFMLGATAALAQPQHDHQFTFPEKILEFSLSETTASYKQHVDAEDTLQYMNSQALYVAGKDTLSIYRSRFETVNAAEKMLKKMADNARAGKGGYADFKKDTVLGIAINSAATRGKAHFFFQHDRDIFWLTGSPLHCYAFLEAFLKRAGLELTQ